MAATAGPLPRQGQEVPIVLGPSVTDGPSTSAPLYTFRCDFMPQSAQRATKGLYVEHPQADGTTNVILVPSVVEDGQHTVPGHFDGHLERAKEGADEMDCVVVYDGTQWTLDLLAGATRVNYRKGVPQGYDLGEAIEQVACAEVPEPGDEPQRQQPGPGDGHAAPPDRAATPDLDAAATFEDAELAAALDDVMFNEGPSGDAQGAGAADDIWAAFGAPPGAQASQQQAAPAAAADAGGMQLVVEGDTDDDWDGQDDAVDDMEDSDGMGVEVF